MSILLELASHAVSGAAKGAAEAGIGIAGRAGLLAVDALKKRFSDNSLRLTNALDPATPRSSHRRTRPRRRLLVGPRQGRHVAG